MTSDLLPCPFCGGEARPEAMVVGWRIGCPRSACSFSGPYSPSKDVAEAIAAWNRRTPSADLEAARAKIERLEGALAAEDDYWKASRALACALPRLRQGAVVSFDMARERRDAARATLKETTDAE
jgi:Lar family restriction alleviation protein